MTSPQNESVVADPDEADDRDIPLTTDADQQTDDLDPNEGEGGAG